MSAEMHREPLAIVGVSAIFAGSTHDDGFWRDILAGKDLITRIPKDRWLVEDYHELEAPGVDRTWATRGAFIPDVEFDSLGFGVPPSILPATDTAQLLALIVAQRVLDDATRGQFAHLDREKVSVILGVTSAQELLGDMVARLQRPIWVKALRETGLPETEVQAACDRISAHYAPWQEATFPGLLGNVVAGRIANRLDLHGTNCVTDAACASTFSAISMAASELWLGTSDMVVTGGVDMMNGIFMHMCFSKTPALSKSGDCRPFSDKADGTLLGEGIGMFALRRLSDAERDGDTIYAVLKGIGTSSDGRSKSVYAPVSEGQARALERAYEAAGYRPGTVELVEAHGTGTRAGDAAEFGGLQLVFGGERPQKQWCALGSVKSQVGHTKAAAGAAGFFKAVMALNHRVLPPTIKVDRPDPRLEIEQSAFYLNTVARPWVRGADHPRRASVSSFGFGGSNFHLTLEEAPVGRALRRRVGKVECFTLADTSADALRARIDALAARAAAAAGTAHDDATLRFLAWTTQYDPGMGPARLCVLAEDAGGLATALQRASARIAAQPSAAFVLPDGTAYALGAEPGGVAFLFPGQGSQYVDMGASVAMAFDAAIAAWDEARTWVEVDGAPVDAAVFPAPVFDDASRAAQERHLTATERAQPAIGVMSLSLLALLREVGVAATATAGHSFGEVIALHAAGVISREDALRTAQRRGAAMAAAATVPGAMAAVRATIDVVSAGLPADGVGVANHNAPDQVVISGEAAAVAAAVARFEAQGIECRPLTVATAFHSPVVAGAADALTAWLDEVSFAAPAIPVWANSTAAPYTSDAGASRALLGGQLARPVRFVEQVEGLYAAGVRTFVEVGPGHVLSGLVERICGDRPVLAVPLDRKGKDGVAQLLGALGRLFVQGLDLRVGALFSGYRAPIDPASLPRPKMAVAVNGGNLGRPYPPPGGVAELPGPNPARAAEVVERVVEKVVEVEKIVEVERVVERVVEVHVAADAAELEDEMAGRNSQGTSDAWLAAFVELQRQTAEAHAAWHQSVSRTHVAFLQTMEAGFQAVAGAPADVARAPLTLPSEPVALATPAWTLPAAPAQAAPVVQAPVVAAPAPVVAAPAPVIAAPAPVVAAPAPAVQAPALAAPVVAPPVVAAPPVARPAAVTLAPPSAPAKPAAVDVTGLMLAVVAEKTGYPVEMLTLEMDLEADLGVDSIKRVEILSAVRERAPGLPEVDAGAMSAMKTLGEIASHLGASAPAASSPAASSPAASSPAAPAPAAGVDVTALMLAVVAEKTGYPVEMLTLEMDLEADLGVDSIKRVEILSAVRERAPGLPEVDAGAMSAMKTLGEIASHLGASSPAASSPVAPAPVAAPAAGVDVTALMLAVVAEKTGYPVEMLTLEMDLEADLGVDSIKRVEILSAVRERAPGLPEVDAGAMSAMKTLGQIVVSLGTAAEAAPAPLSRSASARVWTAPSAEEAPRFVVRPVAAPAVGLGMVGLGAGEAILVDDGAGVATALAAELTARGLSARVVAAVQADAAVLIHLGGLAPVDGPEAAMALQRRVFVDVQRASGRLQAGGALVVVYDAGGDLGMGGAGDRAWLAGLPGLVKTAALEWPKTSCKAIDVATAGLGPAEIAARIAAELFAGGPEIEVGLGVARTTLEAVEGGFASPGARIGAEDVVLASGGARGVTAASLIALASATRCRLVLLGRTAIADEPAETVGLDDDASLKRALLARATARGEKLAPAAIGREVEKIRAGREVRATLAAIEAAGGKARYAPVDVTDSAGLAALLADVRAAWGPVTVLVHGAGVLADKKIVDKTPDQFDRVFQTKVGGLLALLRATADHPVRVVSLFSSVAARGGNVGQCDYAMANETLNRVGADLARRGVFVKSLGWGPWEGGMVTPALKAHFASLGVKLLGVDAGARAFVAEMTGGAPGELELVVGTEPGAESLVGDRGQPRLRLGVHVDRRGMPELDGHRVRGVVVVPVVMAVEWMARAGHALRPGLVLHEIRDVAVLKGIQVPDFDGAGLPLVVEAEQLENGSGATVSVRVIGASGQPHYRAVLRFEPRAAMADGAPAAPAGRTGPADLYAGGVLFHDGAFRLMESVDTIGADGLTARVRGLAAAGWRADAWRTDPGALDAALQAGLLWFDHALRGGSLPTGVESIRLFQPGPLPGVARLVLHGKATGRDAGRCDAWLVDDAGRPLVSLRGIQLHRLPSAPPAAVSVEA